MIIITFVIGCADKPKPYADNVDAARELLGQQRDKALEQVKQEVTSQNIEKLISLGLWDEADTYLSEIDQPKVPLQLAEARLLIKKHQYAKAEQLVSSVLQDQPDNREAMLLQARLDIQAWRLDQAEQKAEDLLDSDTEDPKAELILGRIALLNRNYDQVLERAQKIQRWDSNFAGGYWLESEAHFWSQNPEQAEAPLQKALSIAPFDADARFSYGYAIWRRVDATQLDDMAAQCNLALEVNPLHYLTHWHFGNGHTNLTYADYAHPTDSTVQSLLEKSEDLIAEDQIEEAIEETRSVGNEYPASILPAMARGSIYYMAYDMDRDARLDSAQAIFETVLEEKQNYGPAHNGLAAVIKQRQFEQLDEFESLEDSIAQTPVPTSGSVFYDVFPDAQYYPGDRVTKMIAQQIGPSKAYLPMINKFGSDFAIPPLHIDLAEAMDNNYFRYGTTFDNRQWMDIRGVGSGATGIEYLERGAHLERNVLAHEYAHLYHGRILTDHEDRRIRSLYHDAMKNNHTLDYYAANNESEYFAQGYAGFLSEEKVHPLNHKSMNTREYIRSKDPHLYAFLDSLLSKQKAYLSGDEKVFDDNWAQTHLALAKNSSDVATAKAHLDTALSYSSDYIPVILEYAEVEANEKNYEEADQRVSKAKKLNPNYAPVYVTEAEVLHHKSLNGELSYNKSIDRQAILFDKAERLEGDLAEQAQLNRIQRNRFRQYGHIGKALGVAKQYAEDGPTISTYLRDRVEEAEADYYAMRSNIGYSAEAVDFYESLVDQNPQNFEYRLRYSDALIIAKQLDKAVSVIAEGQRILASADNERDDYKLRRAQISILNGAENQAEGILDEVEINSVEVEDQLLKAQLLVELDRMEDAKEILNSIETTLPAEQASLHFTKAILAKGMGNVDEAEERFKTALSKDPYHLKARIELLSILNEQGKEAEKSEWVEDAEQLVVPLGPDFNREI
ncbi:tetratricopeptide repeat protein [Aliifodinibius salipaludis]|uniref:tetratricopeptide repeat protein n=1 Tax=Fodinibius salipaludis TaxID=2032627 RepID=UPI001C3EE8A3|nr:tetratricopeptide repeat protein [Aliifodinibius salipaludis]